MLYHKPVNFDTVIKKGKADKPAVIFVHGLGMDKGIWVSPGESRILGGSFPVSVLVSKEPRPQAPINGRGEAITKRLSLGIYPKELSTLFHDLSEEGFTVIAWSQKRPSAVIDVAVSELSEVLSLHEEHFRSGIVLIGHSRGGLIARRYLSRGDRRVRCLITLATPHLGSRMAQWASHLAPLAALLSPLLSDAERGTLTYTMKKTAEFLTSRAVRELLPGSPFFQSLGDGALGGVQYLFAGGTHPTLLRVYRLALMTEGEKETVTAVRKVFSFPDALRKIVPDRFFPDEMKKGKGDGLVSIESSCPPWVRRHRVYEVNHAGILFDGSVKADVKDFLNRLT
ncbi:MAG TPA: alpha/beta hydrolase [Thermodesulfovibrionales bacterium]|nr:alpha/beta hydrolase [Thermodesulfovibrionales bacterium]